MKKKSKIKNLEPQKYWERKLNISFKTEFLRYKKIFKKLSPLEQVYVNEPTFNLYQDWEKYIEGKLIPLTLQELFELKKFLNSLQLDNYNTNASVQSYWGPFCIAYIIAVFPPFFFEFTPSSIWSALLCIIPFLAILIIYAKIFDAKISEITFKNRFFKDIKKIVNHNLKHYKG